MRTKAKIEAERRYKERHKRVHLVFNSDKQEDLECLNWLRQQVSDDTEIPSTIKRILTEAMQSH